MDELRDKSIVRLQMVRVSLVARIAHLESVQDNKEWMRDDLDRFTRAKDHVMAAISYLQQSEHGEDELQLELPF
ncbi:MAG: hypothetical protein KAR39_12915 [Thermoplasmata archaeon]|nr:hypothetical protein [Thermoplasmata archaeon]